MNRKNEQHQGTWATTTLHSKPRVMIALAASERGGPYVAHRRILESRLSERYDLVALSIPRARVLLNPVGMWRFVHRIDANKPDIVQCPGLELVGFLSVLACRLAGVKNIVLAVHGSMTEATRFPKCGKRIANFLEILTLRMMTVCYGVSGYVVNWPNMRRYAAKCYGVIYNLPTPLDGGTDSDMSIRTELGVLRSDTVIVSTGRITYEKGYPVLCDVIIEMGRREGVRFVIVGEGEYLETMKNRIKQHHLEACVFFLGHRSDIGRILAGSDIFVLCTLHETLSNSIIEAGQQGLPSVASNVGGIPDVITDGYNGILVPVGNSDAAMKALNRLVDNEQLRRAMGSNARKVIKEKFSTDTILNRLDDMYRRVLTDVHQVH